MMPIMIHSVEIKEIEALVSLIDEPNNDMFDVIHQKILSYGELAIPVLDNMWVNTMGDNESKRIESIIEEIRQEVVVTDFEQWASNANNDIIDGLVIITKYFQPEFNKKHYIALYEKLCRDTWLEINDNLTALEKIKVLNHVFYRVYNFKIDTSLAVQSDTYFLNRVFDYRIGSVMALGILYIAIAQKLSIPIFGVDLPEHFILAYLDDTENIEIPNESNELDVMFYVNASKEGAVFTRNEIKHYINQLKIEHSAKYYSPCTNFMVLKRMMNELIDSLHLENQQVKTSVLKKLLSEVHHSNNLSESASI